MLNMSDNTLTLINITKRTQINSSWTDVITTSLVSVLTHSIPALPHTTNSLAHRQSETPLAQTADGPPPQTSQVESEQTTSERLRKLPTQLNTPNIFVPDLVWVSPNTSDVQQSGRCVPAFTGEVNTLWLSCPVCGTQTLTHWFCWSLMFKGTHIHRRWFHFIWGENVREGSQGPDLWREGKIVLY